MFNINLFFHIKNVFDRFVSFSLPIWLGYLTFFYKLYTYISPQLFSYIHAEGNPSVCMSRITFLEAASF